jgi:hypothetical protein
MLTFTNMQRTRVCTTRHAGAATVYLLVCGLASACSGPGADNPRPRPVAAPAVVPAVQAATARPQPCPLPQVRRHVLRRRVMSSTWRPTRRPPARALRHSRVWTVR